MTERASDSRRLLPGEGASSRGARAAGRMNRAKPTTVRRPSAAAKPSGHPPPGDFIALGSKGQASESKTTSTLLKPAPSGLPSERKRDASASLSGTSALTGTTGISGKTALGSTLRIVQSQLYTLGWSGSSSPAGHRGIVFVPPPVRLL